MRRFKSDDRGQLHTVEGVVSGLLLVITLSYVIGSIAFLSPQTEKTTIVKQTVNAQDILTMLNTEDIPANHSSQLLRAIAAWQGGEANLTTGLQIYPAEDTIYSIDDTINSVLPKNFLYNMNLTYYDDVASVLVTVRLIEHGNAEENTASASEIIVINQGDLAAGSYWGTETPKDVQVQLFLWPV